MRHTLRKIFGGVIVTLLLAVGGAAVTVTAANAQRASAAPLPSSFHLIKTVTGLGVAMCLQPEGGSTAQFASIVLMPCDVNNPAQGWLEQRVGTHHYGFLNQASGHCFDAFDGVFNGARLLQGDCVPISNEEFNTGVDLPNVTFMESRVGFRDTGFCLDVPGGQPATGLPVQIWECNGTPAQRWVIGFPF